MRSYNYVIVPIHDFDQVIYKIRAIDFDQQSYEGEFSLYRPQLFKDNEPIIDLVKNKLLVESINQYKIEERAIVVKRLLGSKNKIESLIESMKFDKISSDEKVNKLTQQIYFLTKDNSFKNLKSMGEVLEKSFNYLISNYENPLCCWTNRRCRRATEDAGAWRRFAAAGTLGSWRRSRGARGWPPRCHGNAPP